MKTIANWADALLGLFYPNLCLACKTNLPPGNDILCISCRYRLPFTEHHLDPENAFAERFWGRIPLEAGASMFHFSKGNMVQHLIHQLKYEGKKEVGLRLGEWYGRELSRTAPFSMVDVIVPVPLHPRKEKKRGYNQSALFASGLSVAMGAPCLPGAIRRVENTETQTRKTREERFLNVQSAFELHQPGLLKGKRILLVDDVMTTGATLEACGHCVLALSGARLLFATIAFAG